jgi:hypothetical protein
MFSDGNQASADTEQNARSQERNKMSLEKSAKGSI